VTLEGVARALGAALAPNAELEAWLRAAFGDAATPHHLRMAMVPEGCSTVIECPGVWRAQSSECSRYDLHLVCTAHMQAQFLLCLDAATTYMCCRVGNNDTPFSGWCSACWLARLGRLSVSYGFPQHHLRRLAQPAAEKVTGCQGAAHAEDRQAQPFLNTVTRLAL